MVSVDDPNYWKKMTAEAVLTIQRQERAIEALELVISFLLQDVQYTKEAQQNGPSQCESVPPASDL